ncbi:hypothetical protein NL676_001928 [Syzygium grande]|nr:hypothetical protein NL676_001928 [Syzygium grande]
MASLALAASGLCPRELNSLFKSSLERQPISSSEIGYLASQFASQALASLASTFLFQFTKNLGNPIVLLA